jgi:hypothetical protein
MATIFITALRETPQKHEDLAVPRVLAIDTEKIIRVQALNDGDYERTYLKVGSRSIKNIKAAEKFGQYLLQTDFENSASSPFNNGTRQNLAACGSGSAQAASATPVTAYFNSVTAATATTMIGVKLPNASATGRLKTAIVIRNAASVDINVVPAASESLDSGTAGVTTIKTGQFAHFYCSTSAKWVTCKGPYY